MDPLILNKIISKKAKEFGIEELNQNFGNDSSIIAFAPLGTRHFFLDCPNRFVEAMHLQAELSLKDQAVRIMWFISPPIIREKTLPGFLAFANEANRYLYRGHSMGRFWIDAKEMDYAFELLAPTSAFSNIEVMEQQLFDIPINHFLDAQIPLMKLATEEWDSGKAIQFLQELRENGHVNNSGYDLE